MLILIIILSHFYQSAHYQGGSVGKDDKWASICVLCLSAIGLWVVAQFTHQLVTDLVFVDNDDDDDGGVGIKW